MRTIIRSEGTLRATVFFNADSRMATISSMNVLRPCVRRSLPDDAGDPRGSCAGSTRIWWWAACGRWRTRLSSRVVNERLLSYLSGAFAVLATLLAVVGLYGVLAFTVSRRTKEIGIRIALGAKEFGVVRLVTSGHADGRCRWNRHWTCRGILFAASMSRRCSSG